jgi:hypothetical protein
MNLHRPCWVTLVISSVFLQSPFGDGHFLSRCDRRLDFLAAARMSTRVGADRPGPCHRRAAAGGRIAAPVTIDAQKNDPDAAVPGASMVPSSTDAEAGNTRKARTP